MYNDFETPVISWDSMGYHLVMENDDVKPGKCRPEVKIMDITHGNSNLHKLGYGAP